MIYGLDNAVINSPYALILSIFLIIGTYELGKIISLRLSFNYILSKISYVEFLYPLIGLYFLSFVSFSISLLGILNILFLKFTAISLILLGIYNLINFKKKLNFVKLYKSAKFEQKIYYLLIFFLIISYFLVASSPITSADALDYHIAVPIEILNYGYFPNEWIWFHSKQAGAGELLIALGLSIGAEQYGNIGQFFGIIAILGIFLFLVSHNTNKNSINEIIILAFLSSPILIFLCSTPKPQLLSIAATTVSFCLTFFVIDTISRKYYSKLIFLVFLFLFISILSKYYFALSSFLIIAYLFFITYKKKYLYKTIIIFIFSIILILVPNTIWKYINFDYNLINSIFYALPRHLPGYESFYESLSSCGYRCFPLWLIYPPSINEFTQTTGLSSLFVFIILLSKIYKKKTLLTMFFLYFLIGLKFGQSNPRFFLEPIIWSLAFILKYGINLNYNNIFAFKIVKTLVILQSSVILLILVFSAIKLFPGSLNENIRKNIMVNHSNGYSLFKWASGKLPKNAKLISSHRSIGLSEVETFSTDFLLYTHNNVDVKKYLEILGKKQPNYLLTYGKNENYYGFKDCIIRKVYDKKNIGRTATRNFYTNKKNDMYNGYIYLIDHNRLPYCYKK